MASSACDICTKLSQSGLQLLQWLHQKNVHKTQKHFLRSLKNQKLEIDLGAGCKETLTFDEANRRYLSRHFSNLDKTVYCCPQVFEYEYPEEPSDIILAAEDGSHAVSVKRDYDTLKRKRKGQLAEEVVIMKFLTMLRKYGMPSFIIHGYQWKAIFIKTLNKLSKLFGKLCTTDGEIDMLIAIPGKCVIVIEVKAVSDESNITGVVNKALSQCSKTFDFLSLIISDIYEGRQVPVIKTAALPNCQSVSAKGLFCQTCLNHIVTKDNLENTNTLYDWLTQLLTHYSDELDASQYDRNIHERLIGRLIGPASLIPVGTMPKSIERTESQISQISQKWYQLTPEQSSINMHWRFLWLTGVPGSGKTVLGLYKANKIVEDSASASERENAYGQGLEKECVLYVINGFSPLFAPSCLLHIYRENITNIRSNCEVFIMESTSDMIDSHSKCQMLPHLIAKLQRKHVGKVINIIIEECQMLLKEVDAKKFEKEWNSLVDDERLGSVWIIQSSFIKSTDSLGSLPGFQMVHLERVMRMSKQNVDFVNIFLGERYKLGHAVTGNRPIIYRTKCICNDPSESSYHCFVCHAIRVVWMLHVAMTELEIRREKLFKDGLGLNDAVLISLQEDKISTFMMTLFNPFIPFSPNEYPKEGTNRIIVSSVRHFTGCERSIVFLDLNSVFYDALYEVECLTRSLGQLVMLDGGCYNEKVHNYEEKVMKLQDAADTGTAEIRELKPSAEDMKTLKKLLIDYLGHEMLRLKQKVDLTLSDGQLDRVNKANIQIKKLEKQQSDAQIWLDQNIIKKLHV